LGRESAEEVQKWENRVRKMDELHRERLYILTVEANEGWKTAGDVSFGNKGSNRTKTS